MELGLIGFVFGGFEGAVILISSLFTVGYCDFGFLEIGFVLHIFVARFSSLVAQDSSLVARRLSLTTHVSQFVVVGEVVVG